MSTITRTHTFSDGTAAYGSQVETEIGAIVDTWNLHDAGTSAWTKVKVSSSELIPVDVISSGATTMVSLDNTATNGDPQVTYKLSGTAAFSHGVDDSDSDTWKLSASAALGTSDLVRITSAGLSTFTGGIIVGGNTTADANMGTISSVTNSSYYEGTFTGTFTGPYTTGSITFTYRRVGKLVMLSFPPFTGTSGAGAPFTASAVIPSSLRPAVNFDAPVAVTDNGAAQLDLGWMNIATTGTIIISKSNTTDNFTAANTAAVSRVTPVVYAVA